MNPDAAPKPPSIEDALETWIRGEQQRIAELGRHASFDSIINRLAWAMKARLGLAQDAQGDADAH